MPYQLEGKPHFVGHFEIELSYQTNTSAATFFFRNFENLFFKFTLYTSTVHTGVQLNLDERLPFNFQRNTSFFIYLPHLVK